VFSVKSGATGVKDVRDLRGVVVENRLRLGCSSRSRTYPANAGVGGIGSVLPFNRLAARLRAAAALHDQGVVVRETRCLSTVSSVECDLQEGAGLDRGGGAARVAVLGAKERAPLALAA
jgi:hypothetical protein